MSKKCWGCPLNARISPSSSGFLRNSQRGQVMRCGTPWELRVSYKINQNTQPWVTDTSLLLRTSGFLQNPVLPQTGTSTCCPWLLNESREKCAMFFQVRLLQIPLTSFFCSRSWINKRGKAQDSRVSAVPENCFWDCKDCKLPIKVYFHHTAHAHLGAGSPSLSSIIKAQ